MSNLGNQLLADPRDYVLLIGFATIFGMFGYMVVTGPWDDPIAGIIIYGLVGVFIVVPFTPWFGLLKERWNDAR